jgi:hypothetical protein
MDGVVPLALGWMVVMLSMVPHTDVWGYGGWRASGTGAGLAACQHLRDADASVGGWRAVQGVQKKGAATATPLIIQPLRLFLLLASRGHSERRDYYT